MVGILAIARELVRALQHQRATRRHNGGGALPAGQLPLLAQMLCLYSAHRARRYPLPSPHLVDRYATVIVEERGRSGAVGYTWSADGGVVRDGC